MIKLPFSRTKRYLTGIDWIIHAIDHMSKKVTGVGNLSQIVLELKGSLSPDQLKERLTSFIQQHPVTNGQTARDYNLAPYWKIDPKTSFPLKLKIHELGNNTTYPQVISFLEENLNLPFDDIGEHLVFHLLNAGKRSYLAMTFDHRLLDARGAEAFLGMFQQKQQGSLNATRDIFLVEPAHLSHWKEKFQAGKRLNRIFRRFAQNSPPVFPLPDTPEKMRFKFKSICFDKDQTSRIFEHAYEEAGYLMFMPYALAVTLRILEKFFSARGAILGDFVIPVSIDTRPPERVKEEVFFNHVSFFIFQIPSRVVNFSDLLTSIKNQMYDQVKSGLLKDLKDASLLMRILPLSILGRLMHAPLKGEIASFCFSYVGETAYEASEFLGQKVLNIFHMPRPPVPPGLGVFFNQFQGKLSATISYIEGILSEEEIKAIAENLRFRMENHEK